LGHGIHIRRATLNHKDYLNGLSRRATRGEAHARLTPTQPEDRNKFHNTFFLRPLGRHSTRGGLFLSITYRPGRRALEREPGLLFIQEHEPKNT
jgi:hypothetical protein